MATILYATGTEYLVRYTHGTVYHGQPSLWSSIHSSHHAHQSTLFEANDLLGVANALIFAPLMQWVFFMPATIGTSVLFGALSGVSMFGVGYILVHDGLHHKRFPVSRLGRIPWLRRVADAHAKHHTSSRGPPFGFFLGPHEVAAAESGRDPDPAPLWLRTGLLITLSVGSAGLVLGF